jgi:hypothetical protein
LIFFAIYVAVKKPLTRSTHTGRAAPWRRSRRLPHITEQGAMGRQPTVRLLRQMTDRFPHEAAKRLMRAGKLCKNAAHHRWNLEHQLISQLRTLTRR